MSAKEIAAKLNGSEYPLRISQEIRRVARQAGLVIVYGASDDLMEFDGAIHDEMGAGTAFVDTEGLVPDFCHIDKEGRGAKDRLRDYFRRERGAVEIRAIWDRDGYSWQYETSIPHETFEIVEDGDTYCRGIVFALADAVAS